MAQSPIDGEIPWNLCLQRALHLKCPACGEGGLFRSYLKPVEKCETCGIKWPADIAGDGPSYFVMFLVIVLVPVLALVTEARFEPPAWVHVMLWLPLTVGLSLGLLPFFKAVFIAIEYKTNPDLSAHS